MAGGGPFADGGGVAFEEVVDEGVEGFAQAHAGFDEFVEGVSGTNCGLAGGALVVFGSLEFLDALVEGVLEVVFEAAFDKGVVQGEVGDGLDEGAGASGEFGVVVAVGHAEAVHDGGALEVFGDAGGGAIPVAEVAIQGVAEDAAIGGADGFAAALLLGDFLADGDGERVEFTEFRAGFGLRFFLSGAVSGGIGEGGGLGGAKGGHGVEAFGAGVFAVVHRSGCFVKLLRSRESR